MSLVRLQLVLQGGGAKMFALIAALEAIEDEIEAKPKWLEVTRVAGTSAGAIIGGLFAAGVTAREMRAKFAKVDLSQLLTLPSETAFLGRARRKLALADRILSNRPLASDVLLREAMLELLKARELNNPDLKATKIPLRVIAANVSDRTPKIYDSEDALNKDKLVRVLQHSSAIPFIFATARPDQAELVMDGGLVENLPVQSLARETEKYGQILALSFLDPPGKTPNNALELALSILDTAMNSSVRSARKVPGLHLVELDPSGVGTFDFVRAQAILDGKETAPYALAKKSTLKELEEIKGAGGAVVSNVRWDGIEPLTSGQLLEVYKSQQGERLFQQHLRRLTVFCNSLLKEGEEDFGTPDHIIQEMEFSPGDAPLDCLMARIYVDEGQMPRTVDTLITDIDGGAVAFKAIPVMSLTDEGLRVFALQLSFVPPLLNTSRVGRYRLRQEFRMASALPKLPKGELEKISSMITRAKDTAELVELIVHIPKSFGGFDTCAFRNGADCSRRAWQPGDTYKAGFEAIIWKADNVPNGSVVGFELWKQGARPSENAV